MPLPLPFWLKGKKEGWLNPKKWGIRKKNGPNSVPKKNWERISFWENGGSNKFPLTGPIKWPNPLLN